MARTNANRRSLLGIGVLLSLMGTLAVMCGDMRGPAAAAPVALSPPGPGSDPPAVQLEPPSEEVKLDGGEPVLAGRAASGWVESGNPDTIPLLARYLKSEDEVVQLAALAELAGMGAKAKRAVPMVVGALRDPKSSIRVEAAVTLIRLDVQAKAAVGALAKELCSQDPAARARAAGAIEQLVSSAPEVLGFSCWGPDPPQRIARPWVRKAVGQAIGRSARDRGAR